MFLKITVIAIVAFVATAEDADVWDGFSAKWAENVNDGFYELPRTLNDAMREGWTTVSGPKAPTGLTLRVYANDPRVGLYFRTRKGKVGGLQIALPVAELVNVPINYTANPAITKKILNGKEYYTATALFSDDQETTGVRQLSLEVDGEFKEIPTKTDLVTSETPYYSKRCIEWMGHHFYQVNSTTDVSSLFPWFLLSVEDDVIGIGFQAIGTVSSAAKRTWFEKIPPTQLAETIPDAPSEIAEAIAEYGLISFHVWFKKNPVGIQCSDECTATYNGTEKSSSSRAIRKRRAIGSANFC